MQVPSQSHRSAKRGVLVCIAGGLFAAMMSACPETKEVPSGPAVTDTRPLPPPTRSGAEPKEAQPSAENVEIGNARRHAVQLFASKDESEVRARLGAIEKAGLRGAVVEADLGDRGVWHRLLVGSYSEPALAEIRGRAIASDKRLRALLPEVPPGEPFFIVQEAPPAELAPRASGALAGLAPDSKVHGAITRLRAGAPSGAIATVVGDARARVVDAAGAVREPLPQPRFPGCAACVAIAAAGRVQGVEILLADDLAGNDASEVLLAYSYGAGKRLASLVTFGSLPDGQAKEVGGFVLEDSDANSRELSRYSLLDADADPDAELLVDRFLVTSHEGALCEVRLEPLIYNLDKAELRPMDESFFAALGATARSGGNTAFAAYAGAVRERNDDELMLRAGVSYLSQASASGDAEGRKLFLAWLEGLKSPRAALIRVHALARLTAARPEYRAAFAAKLDRALERLLQQPAGQLSVAGCDEAPLARPGKWSADLPGLVALAKKTEARSDLRSVPDSLFTSLASAYPPASPIAKKLDVLIQRLQPATVRHATVKRLVESTRESVK